MNNYTKRGTVGKIILFFIMAGAFFLYFTFNDSRGSSKIVDETFKTSETNIQNKKETEIEHIGSVAILSRTFYCPNNNDDHCLVDKATNAILEFETMKACALYLQSDDCIETYPGYNIFQLFCTGHKTTSKTSFRITDYCEWPKESAYANAWEKGSIAKIDSKKHPKAALAPLFEAKQEVMEMLSELLNSGLVPKHIIPELRKKWRVEQVGVDDFMNADQKDIDSWKNECFNKYQAIRREYKKEEQNRKEENQKEQNRKKQKLQNIDY